MKSSYLKYIFALLLFGSNGIVASLIQLSSCEIVLFRTMIGSFLLIIIFLSKGEKFTFYTYKKQSVFIGISGIALGTSWIFLYEAYREIGVSLASLTYYCGPVIVMMLSPLIFREKLTRSKICGFLVVIAGVFLINATAFGNNVSVFGLTYGLLSAVCYSLMVIFNKKAKDISGLENSVIELFMAFITVAVFVGVKQGFQVDINTQSIIPTLVLGIFNTGIGCYFYFSSIAKLPLQTVSICGYI